MPALDIRVLALERLVAMEPVPPLLAALSALQAQVQALEAEVRPRLEALEARLAVLESEG